MDSILRHRFGNEGAARFWNTFHATWITERDFQLARAHGFNFVRHHSHVLPPEYFEVTDEIIRFVSFRIPTAVTIVNRIPGDLRCRLPEERLRQALLNLILNSAATMGDDPGSITIETGTEGNDLLLSVTDDGPGLDEDILKTGGRPLTSANMGSQHFRLAVARRITRDAGGNMKLSNQSAEEGQHGTRVVLLLPSCVDDG